jgi:hypothetical protein
MVALALFLACSSEKSRVVYEIRGTIPSAEGYMPPIAAGQRYRVWGLVFSETRKSYTNQDLANERDLKNAREGMPVSGCA